MRGVAGSLSERARFTHSRNDWILCFLVDHENWEIVRFRTLIRQKRTEKLNSIVPISMI